MGNQAGSIRAARNLTGALAWVLPVSRPSSTSLRARHCASRSRTPGKAHTWRPGMMRAISCARVAVNCRQVSVDGGVGNAQR